MKLLVTGVAGQLGYDVVNEALSRHHNVTATDILIPDSCPTRFVTMDITEKNSVNDVVKTYKPDAVIHCAAWTNVDGAEDQGNKNTVNAINSIGTQIIAEACRIYDSKMIYISTDYVFNGVGTVPWKPDCKEYAPLNTYGQSKLEGEFAVTNNLKKYFIVRTAWVFGLNGKNFIKTMINAGRSHDVVNVVDDQIGTPTYTKDLARLLVDMIETELYGYYHVTNSESAPGEYISWADLAEEAYRVVGMKVKVNRISTEEYGFSKAKRPLNSRLDKSKLQEKGFIPLPDWRDAVKRYIEEAELQ